MSPPTAAATNLVRSRAVLALVLLFSVATVAAIALLQFRSDASRAAELKLAGVDAALTRLQGDPFAAMPVVGGTPERARSLVAADKRAILLALDELDRAGSPSALRKARAPLRANFAVIDRILPISSSPSFNRTLDPRFFPLLKSSDETQQAVGVLLVQAQRDYRARAWRDRVEATAGSAGAILLLFGAFALFFRRALRARSIAERLAEENARLAAVNRHEARTDALTGLPNRRALIDDLDAKSDGDAGEHLIAAFDLDGFKHYNDTFGHPAGDGLLTRLGGRLQAAVSGSGTAYRMGGDEFCILVAVDAHTPTVVQRAADALSEIGDAFQVGCSYGTAVIGLEVSTPEAALRVADQRMYEHKTGRASASRQSSDVLLTVLNERSAELREHGADVARLATRIAEQLGLDAADVKRVGLAAELHDVGKTAIPDALLGKAGPLDAGESTFMREHTVIGERILLAAPSLVPAAKLVRSSHEAFDGTGYPDALRGEAIPLGSRIIAVCDAFDAMTSERPYRIGLSPQEAIAELRRCAGAQFDPRVVEAFCGQADDRPRVRSRRQGSRAGGGGSPAPRRA